MKVKMLCSAHGQDEDGQPLDFPFGSEHEIDDETADRLIAALLAGAVEPVEAVEPDPSED
jgi:hypothetical protein